MSGALRDRANEERHCGDLVGLGTLKDQSGASTSTRERGAGGDQLDVRPLANWILEANRTSWKPPIPTTRPPTNKRIG
jgi:hypothetical protein